MLGRSWGLRSAPTWLETTCPFPTVTHLRWMHDWGERWSTEESCKPAWKLLGRQSLEEAVPLWVAVL